MTLLCGIFKSLGLTNIFPVVAAVCRSGNAGFWGELSVAAAACENIFQGERHTQARDTGTAKKDPMARRHRHRQRRALDSSWAWVWSWAELNDLESHSCQRAAMRTDNIHGTFPFLYEGRFHGGKWGSYTSQLEWLGNGQRAWDVRGRGRQVCF